MYLLKNETANEEMETIGGVHKVVMVSHLTHWYSSFPTAAWCILQSLKEPTQARDPSEPLMLLLEEKNSFVSTVRTHSLNLLARTSRQMEIVGGGSSGWKRF